MNQIYHSWDKFECYKAGFYDTVCELSEEDGKIRFAEFFTDLNRFEEAIKRVFEEWKFSCEHFLSNSSCNRIAWIGQAAVCIAWKIPSKFKGGYRLLLSEEEQKNADRLAEKYLNMWLKEHEKEKLY